MIADHFILENKQPKAVNLLTWAEWFGVTENRMVKQDIHVSKKGKFQVSTIFLGIDHNFMGTGEPLLFETMIFEPGFDGDYLERCSTYDEAIVQHQVATKHLREKGLI